MKAIILVDIDENIKEGENECELTIINPRIRILPQKKDMSKTYYECGWNDCLDEILGGEE